MTYIINDEIIERIHDEANIVDLVSEYLNLKKSGANFVGLCPFHTEKTPSFTVSETKQFYHCFGCGEGGDVISFIMKMENMTFIEASKYLANKLGIPLAEKSEKEKKLDRQREKIYEINREAARYFYRNLRQDPRALSYLSNRKIKRQTLIQFGLGLAPDSWDSIYRYLLGKGYDEKDIEKSGLIAMRRDKSGYYDRFRNRIIFPIIDTKDRVIGFGGRVLDETMPKYLNSRDTLAFAKGNNLYGLNLVRKQSNRERIILVEGYMDVIALFNQGINYAVASLGTAFTQNQGKLLRRFGKEVLICYDSDTAGINASIKAIDILKEEGVEAKIILLPEGQDPDDYIRENGINEFKQLIKKPLNYIDYFIHIYKERFDLSSTDGKIKFTREIARIIKDIKSPIERDVYIDKVSKESGIGKDAIEKEVLGRNSHGNARISRDKYINRRFSYNKDKIEPVNIVVESGHLKAEKILIKLMIEKKGYFDIIKRYLSKEEFLDYECRSLAEIIFNEYQVNPDLHAIEGKDLVSMVSNIDKLNLDKVQEILDQNLDYFANDLDKSIQDLIKTLEFSKLKMELDSITRQIQDIGKNLNGENIEILRKLSLRQMELKNKLESYV